MTAFDRAWNLMKMPLLPYSLKDKGDMKWEGIFEDPKTKERLPLRFRGDNTIDNEGLENELDNGYSVEDFPKVPDDPHSRLLPDVEWAGLIGDEYPPRSSLRTDWASPQIVHNVETSEEHRRKGYASALYDALAHILMQTEGRTLYRNSDQLSDGKRFWKDKKEWPVRDDL